jgi:hypothetical protein
LLHAISLLIELTIDPPKKPDLTRANIYQRTKLIYQTRR